MPDFVRRFFVSCAQISGGVGVVFASEIRVRRRKIGHKAGANSRTFAAFLVGFQVSYSCFWRVSSSKFLLQACLHQIYNLLPLVSISISYSGVFSIVKRRVTVVLCRKKQSCFCTALLRLLFTLLWQSPVPFQKQR